MTTLDFMCSDGDGGPACAGATIARVVFLVIAIVLVVRDIRGIPVTATKFWVVALAVLLPELYVLLHGIQTSAIGASFFQSSPIEPHQLLYTPSLSSKSAKSASSASGGGWLLNSEPSSASSLSGLSSSTGTSGFSSSGSSGM